MIVCERQVKHLVHTRADLGPGANTVGVEQVALMLQHGQGSR